MRPPSRIAAARGCRTGCWRSSSRRAAGLGGGANGTYGPASVAGAIASGGGGGVVSAASAGASASADVPALAGLAGLASSPNSSVDSWVCADARRPGSNSATTASAAKPSLSCLLLRSRSLIARLPSASPVVGGGMRQRGCPPARARSSRRVHEPLHRRMRPAPGRLAGGAGRSAPRVSTHAGRVDVPACPRGASLRRSFRCLRRRRWSRPRRCR